MDKLDILQRDDFVNRLFNLIENISDNKKKASFALNGKWGCGKSFVLDMLEERLTVMQSEKTGTDKYFVIRYNCWEYDYYTEPLVAIISAIVDFINIRTQLWPDSNKKAMILGGLKVVGNILFTAANSGIKEKTGIDIKKTLTEMQEGIESGQQKYKEDNKYDEFYEVKEALEYLKKQIALISEDYTVVLLVDELDRCIPEYALRVLERLHHLTGNIGNIITVLSIDKEQLQRSIEKTFGFNEPSRYLEKFVDFEVKLDYGKISGEITEKYSEYISLFDKDAFTFEDPLEEFLQAIFSGIDIRMQEKIVNRAYIAHNLLYTDKKDYVFMCMELLVAVLIIAYDNSCSTNASVSFADRQHEFLNIFRNSKNGKNPEFAEMFDEKMKNIAFRIRVGFSDYPTEYVLPEYASLYGAILYVWYWMHPQNHKIQITHVKDDLYSKLEYHKNELQKFVETVNMIR